MAAAGLDVFESEPLVRDSPLLKFDNVLLTSHMAGITYETFSEIISRAFDCIRRFDSGDVSVVQATRVV